MLLTKYDPFRELRDLERRIYGNFPASGEEDSLSGFTPVVNTREGEYAFHIEADLPGVKKEDISVDVSDGVLTISGERQHKDEIKKEDYYKLESSYGKFQRSFTLPEGTDTENITASCDNGVLEITIPKLKVEKTKQKVEVK